MITRENTKLCVFTGTVLCVSMWLIYKYFKYNKKPRVVGKVTGLYVHPLKSGRGIQVESAFAGEQGLVWNGMEDRSWAVRYERNNLKITAREEPSLLKINVTAVSSTKAEFAAEGFRTLTVNLDSVKDNKPTNILMFGDDIEAEDIGDEAAAWISEFLGKLCRMTFKPRNRSLRKPDFKINWRLRNNPTDDKDLASFQDGFPYMMMGEDSLADINEKITLKKYTMRTFRPNIVIKSGDGKPWAEDGWIGVIKIGTAIFAIASPCPRCIFTTIDPETYEKDKSGEPLRTLRTFRYAKGEDRKYLDVYKNSPFVGMNTVVIKTGEISVGDEIILFPQ